MASREIRWHPDPGRKPAAATGEAAVRATARALDEGWILVHPTSTVYGLGSRPDPALDAAIHGLKRREPAPLIHLAADLAALERAAPDLAWTPAARALAAALWPGPLTLVLADGDGSLGVRVDPHPAVRAVLELAGGLMTSTSLNVGGREPARTRGEVLATIDELGPRERPLGWLDAGDLAASAASTVLDVRRGDVRTLRPGAVSAETIARALEGRAGGSP